jgi:hypothetical protein
LRAIGDLAGAFKECNDVGELELWFKGGEEITDPSRLGGYKVLKPSALGLAVEV